MLDMHFSPQKSLQSERYSFCQAHQAPNEPVSQYLTRLRRLGEHCDFDKYSLDEAIKDQLIEHCYSNRCLQCEESSASLSSLIALCYHTSHLARSQIRWTFCPKTGSLKSRIVNNDPLCLLHEVIYTIVSLSTSIHHFRPYFFKFFLPVFMRSFYKFASHLDDLERFNIVYPYSSDDSWHTWSDNLSEDSGSNSESEVAEMPRGGKREEQASTLRAAACHVSVGRRCQ